MAESRHGNVLRQKLDARRQELLEAMAGGLAKKNYWRLCGQVAAIEEAMKLSDDADYELSGGH